MTEPPRPPGDDEPPAPYSPYSGNESTSGSTPPSPPGGYGPPGGSVPPPGGYAPPGAYGGPPAGYANSEDKQWTLITHFGGIFVGFIAPLVALLAQGPKSPTVRAHAIEALNFQITWGVATVIAYILAVCSIGFLFFLPMITWGVVIIFSILAGIQANDGKLYQYPMTVRLVK